MNIPANNTQPSVLIFDLGGVLLDWNPRYLYRKLFPGDEEGMERFLEEVGFMEWNKAQDAGRPFAQGVEELCAAHPEYCEMIRAYDKRFPESVRGPIWGTVEILRGLREAGVSLHGLSNWSAEKYRLMRPRYEFLDWFGEIIISGEVGVNKPDERIFQALLERIGRGAEECLFIDDSLVNVEAARELGFDAILFLDPGQLGEELARRGVRGME